MTDARTNAQRLADWRVKNTDAVQGLAELFRKARGIPPSPQSPIALTLLAQDVEQALGVIFKIEADSDA